MKEFVVILWLHNVRILDDYADNYAEAKHMADKRQQYHMDTHGHKCSDFDRMITRITTAHG